MSPMQWLTRSAPIPRQRPWRAAKATLVPTPSVEATSTASGPSAAAEYIPPKPCAAVITPGVRVEATASAIRATARLPASMSTPACR